METLVFFAMVWASSPPHFMNIAMSLKTCEAVRRQNEWRRRPFPVVECMRSK